MNKAVFALIGFLILIAGAVNAQSTSTYTRSGIGDILYSYSARSLSLGHSGSALINKDYISMPDNIFTNIKIQPGLTLENPRYFPKKLSSTDREIICTAINLQCKLLSDDGAIINYCIDNEMPYMNSLMIPIYLSREGKIDINQAYSYLNDLIKLGRYSKEVEQMAFDKLD